MLFGNNVFIQGRVVASPSYRGEGRTITIESYCLGKPFYFEVVAEDLKVIRYVDERVKPGLLVHITGSLSGSDMLTDTFVRAMHIFVEDRRDKENEIQPRRDFSVSGMPPK
jgi:hypothetical protein